MNSILRLRWRPAVAAFALAFAPGTAGAQDSTRARPETVSVRIDSVPVPHIRVPTPVQPAWRYQIDFGFQDLAGNRDLSVFNGTFVVERRRRDRFILNLKLDGRYGRSNGVEAVNSQLARLRFDWHPQEPVSPFLGLDLVRDRIRKVARRIQLGTGANFNVDRRDASRTTLSVGFVQDHQTYTAGTTPASSDDTRWMARASTVRLLGQSTRIEMVARYQPTTSDVADYLASFEGSVRVAFTRRMGFTTRFEFTRDSRPPAGVQTDDRALSAGLSFAW